MERAVPATPALQMELKGNTGKLDVYKLENE